MRRPAAMLTAGGRLWLVLLLVVSVLGAPPEPAFAQGRCSTSTGGVEERIASFWQCVDALGRSDHLTAEDLGQWARNVIERAPDAAIRVFAFRSATEVMQLALELGSAGIPPAPPKSADVESRIVAFWQKVNALVSCDTLTATDLGQWALNVIDRDPSRRIRVEDFRSSTASMQIALDNASAPCGAAQQLVPVSATTCPGATGRYAICGRLTRRSDGAPVAGAEVSAHWGHNPLGTVLTGADGRYTVTIPRALNYVGIQVQAIPDQGLAAVRSGNVSCDYAQSLFNVSRHVTGIDLTMPNGFWITMGARDATGALVAGLSPYLAAYLPQYDRWCFVDRGPQTSFELPDNARERSFYPAGTYRLGVDPGQSSRDLEYPFTWYPSARSAAGGTDIVLDRDLILDAGYVVTLPPKVYRISGRISMDLTGSLMQVVTVEGGAIGVAAEGYVRNWDTGDYSFVVPPGTYKVRVWQSGADGSNEYWYAPDGAGTYDAGRTVTITNADVTGIDIILN